MARRPEQHGRRAGEYTGEPGKDSVAGGSCSRRGAVEGRAPRTALHGPGSLRPGRSLAEGGGRRRPSRDHRRAAAQRRKRPAEGACRRRMADGRVAGGRGGNSRSPSRGVPCRHAGRRPVGLAVFDRRGRACQRRGGPRDRGRPPGHSPPQLGPQPAELRRQPEGGGVCSCCRRIAARPGCGTGSLAFLPEDRPRPFSGTSSAIRTGGAGFSNG